MILIPLPVTDPGYHEKGQFFTVTQGQVLHDPKQAVTVIVDVANSRREGAGMSKSLLSLSGTLKGFFKLKLFTQPIVTPYGLL